MRGRPPRCRRVSCVPEATFFKPAGVPMRMLEEVCLHVDEAEAIRLKDLEGLEQEEGADRMGISRPTFQRILVSGRQKVADALLNGKAMKIEGGHIELAEGTLRCSPAGCRRTTPRPREDAEQHSSSITTPQEVRGADIRIQMP